METFLAREREKERHARGFVESEFASSSIVVLARAFLGFTAAYDASLLAALHTIFTKTLRFLPDERKRIRQQRHTFGNASLLAADFLEAQGVDRFTSNGVLHEYLPYAYDRNSRLVSAQSSYLSKPVEFLGLRLVRMRINVEYLLPFRREIAMLWAIGERCASFAFRYETANQGEDEGLL